MRKGVFRPFRRSVRVSCHAGVARATRLRGCLFCMVLFGRTEEMKLLVSVYSALCSSGRSATILVEAAPGCGKSAVMAALAEHAESAGAVVLQTVAVPHESEVPLSLLRNIVDGSPFYDMLAPRFRALSGGPSTEQDDAACEQIRRDSERYELQREFCASLRELSRTTPVVLAVDDVQHGDRESLRQLLHLARHCRTAPLMMLFTRSPATCGRQEIGFGAELLRQPNFTRVRLPRLDRGAVLGLLAEAWPGRQEAHTVDRYVALSGGNPLLLRALMEDHRAHAGPGANRPLTELRTGQSYRDALLVCLERGGELSRKVATGLAVLGGPAHGDLLADLLALSPGQLTETLNALAESGIVEGRAFRSPHARDTVLNALDPARRHELHSRAAELLHARGAPPCATAEHLVQAGRADGVWGVGVLREAAEQALLDDHVKQAVSYLELAHAACEDPTRRIEIRIRLALIAQRISAATAELHLAEVSETLRLCPVPDETVGSFVELLLAHGWLEQARDIIERTAPGDGEPDGAGTAEDEICGAWDRGGEPAPWPLAASSPDTGAQEDPPDCGAVPPRAQGRLWGRRPAASWGTQRPRELEQYVAGAEGLLEITPLMDFTFYPLLGAMQSLLHNGAVDRVVHWCDTFTRRSAHRDAPGWEASFAALRAEASLHRGDLAAAEKGLRDCLSALPQRHRSTSEGAVVAHLVVVKIAQGDLDEAARCLSRPTARSLAGSVHWLVYRRARGLYHLANHRYHSALRDFNAAGRLAGLWGLDRPGLLPWRTDAAEAMLRLGEREEALRLATEQLAMAENGSPRVRGISLRMRALAADQHGRVALLGEALTELRRSGDRLAVARVLFDLADAHEEAGESRRAVVSRRRATRLAKECGARSLLHRDEGGSAPEASKRIHLACAGALPVPPEEAEAQAEAEPDEGAPDEVAADRPGGPAAGPRQELSDSERKVAALAANGYTNREISVRLFITKSTVEQHLTRVYRKLRVAGREELPLDLETSVEV
ncbi:AAA family ATPase [Streptomyces sp. NPDC048507]|uniref:helix-turn-helix transcriptional regulator n=1 Tax=Streptomyces sp. NPDC048507 TaxID=3365560 RepID=UPI00372403AE